MRYEDSHKSIFIYLPTYKSPFLVITTYESRFPDKSYKEKVKAICLTIFTFRQNIINIRAKVGLCVNVSVTFFAFRPSDNEHLMNLYFFSMLGVFSLFLFDCLLQGDTIFKCSLTIFWSVPLITVESSTAATQSRLTTALLKLTTFSCDWLWGYHERLIHDEKGMKHERRLHYYAYILFLFFISFGIENIISYYWIRSLDLILNRYKASTDIIDKINK